MINHCRIIRRYAFEAGKTAYPRQGGQVTHRDHTITIGVEQGQLFAGEFRCIGKIHHREERLPRCARARLVDFHLEVLCVNGNAIDALQTDSVRCRLEGKILLKVQRIGRIHDGQAEIEVVDDQANGAGVWIMDISIFCPIVVWILHPIRPAHADEGLHIRAAEGQEGQFRGFRPVRRDGHAIGDAQPEFFETLIDLRVCGIRQQPASHRHRLHLALFEGEAAGNVNELGDRERPAADTRPDDFAREIQVDQLGAAGVSRHLVTRRSIGSIAGKADLEIDRRIPQQRPGTLDDRSTEVEFHVDVLRIHLENPGPAIHETGLRGLDLRSGEGGQLLAHRLEDAQSHGQILHEQSDRAIFGKRIAERPCGVRK